MAFNVPILSRVAFYPFNLIANSAYRSASKIIAVSDTYVDRAKKVNGHSKTLSVYIGTEPDLFDNNKSKGKKADKKEEEFYGSILPKSGRINCKKA